MEAGLTWTKTRCLLTRYGFPAADVSQWDGLMAMALLGIIAIANIVSVVVRISDSLRCLHLCDEGRIHGALHVVE